MFRRLFTTLLAVGVVLTLRAFTAGGASTAQARPSATSYQFTATVHVPVPPDATQNGWCYDTATVDPHTHLYYLADGANKQITVIHPDNLRITSRGVGQFTGIGGCHSFNYDLQGPNGTAILGNHLFASNGDSHVLVFNLKTGQRLADVNTQGLLRADEMTVAGDDLVVTNPAEKPRPYISFINLKTYHLDEQFPFKDATGGLEQPQFWHGHLYISVPQSTQSPHGGEVDELAISNLKTIQIIHHFAFGTCQPAGLAVRSDGLAAVGCGGPQSTSQEILNLNNGHQTPVNNVAGVDIVAVNGPDFFYVSYAIPALVIADSGGKILQMFSATAASHTVSVDPDNGTVWVPQDKGDINVYTPTT